MQNRIEWCDSFKFFAMVGVFLVHCGGAVPECIQFIARNGNRGVELFFIITGFLACINPPKIDTINDFLQWIVKKYIRIMPLTIIAYIISYLFNYINSDSIAFMGLSWFYKNNPSQTNIFSLIVSLSPISFLFINNVDGYVACYFLTNILYALLHKKLNKSKTVCACLICMIFMFIIPEIVIQVCSYLGVEHLKWISFFEGKMRAIYCFLIGMVLYSILPALERIKAHCANIVCIANLGTLLACIALFFGFYNDPNLNTIYVTGWITIIIICQLLHKNILLVNKVWGKIGKNSWAFYYVNVPIIFLLSDLVDRGFGIVVVFMLSIILSAIITKWIEKPIISFLKKYIGYCR